MAAAPPVELGLPSDIRRGPDLGCAARGAGFAALVTLGLTIPILALRTDAGASGLVLIVRPHSLVFPCLAAFILALCVRLKLHRPQALGGPAPWLRPAILVGAVAILFVGYHATRWLFAPLLAWLDLPVRFLTPTEWSGLSGLVILFILIQGFVIPAFPALVRATRRQKVASEKDAVTTSARPEAQSGFALSSVLAPLFLGVAVAFPIIMHFATGGLSQSRYWIDLGILILTYVMLGWGLNIVVGLAGLLDLGYVAFYAVGAYSYALLALTFDLSFWICLPLAGILAAFWGILLGFPVLRLRGDYLAIVTLAFGEIIRLVLINWVDVTGGGAGLSSIPRATFFGLPFTNDEAGFITWLTWLNGWLERSVVGIPISRLLGGPEVAFDPMQRIIFLYYLILALALVTNLVTIRLRRLPIGRAWEALREDEIACRSLGINTTNTKLTAFAIGAMFGGFAGSFFAVRQGFISPESFNFLESATILAIVVLGGMGSQIGVAIAAIVIIGAPEMLRNLGFLKAVFGEDFDPNEYRLLLFGLAMAAMMVWRPRGLISVREPTVVLKEKKAISGSLVREGHG